jgi:hypothetical protein
MTKDEALDLALEALEGVLDDSPKVLEASIAGGLYEVIQCRDAITAIKQARAAPTVQELQRYSPDGEGGMELDSLGAYIKLQDVAAPPKQPAPVQPVKPSLWEQYHAAQPAPVQENTMIYKTFEQWKSGNVLEHGVPRTEHYSEDQLDLVEMGWNYGYDAGRAVEQALDKKAENARELGLDYEPADGTQVSKVWWDGEKLMAEPIDPASVYTTPPAAPVLEGRDWSLLEATQESLREHVAEIKRLKAAQPAVPDAIIEAGESPEFRDGWNECRETMLQMLKARSKS